ncbi:MAG TPA: hypothetical protein VGE63_01325 [Candidatus Paceibacterota bacterium]
MKNLNKKILVRFTLFNINPASDKVFEIRTAGILETELNENFGEIIVKLGNDPHVINPKSISVESDDKVYVKSKGGIYLLEKYPQEFY